VEGSLIQSNPNATITWSGNLFSHEDIHTGAAIGVRNVTGAITSSNRQDSDVVTLIGVVPEVREWTDLEKLSDDQLMIAVAQGECSALEKLYDRYVRSCFGLALSIVYEPSLAEEIVQEVFVKVWRRPETFSPGRGTFYIWLLTIVRNEALDKLRRAKRWSAMQMSSLSLGSADSDTSVDMLPDTAPTPYDQAWTEEVRGVVQQALRQLPVSEYQVITLAYFGGLTQPEIANELQQPLGTVKSRARSALRRLRNMLVAQGALSD
jgi:RNA polymerase sigma-70 factor (ECF subfamily)